jgi:hypothetical protein
VCVFECLMRGLGRSMCVCERMLDERLRQECEDDIGML